LTDEEIRASLADAVAALAEEVRQGERAKAVASFELAGVRR
jgi:hypothetical protein